MRTTRSLSASLRQTRPRNLHQYRQVRHCVLGVIIVKRDLFLLLGSVVTTVVLSTEEVGRARFCAIGTREERKNAKEETDKQLGPSWLRKAVASE